MKEEALKLADELDALHQYVPSEAPSMIRILVEELDKQTKRLSDEQILNIWLPFATYGIKGKIEFARAIEKEHGIK